MFVQTQTKDYFFFVYHASSSIWFLNELNRFSHMHIELCSGDVFGSATKKIRKISLSRIKKKSAQV